MVGEQDGDDAVRNGWWFLSGFLELAHSRNTISPYGVRSRPSYRRSIGAFVTTGNEAAFSVGARKQRNERTAQQTRRFFGLASFSCRRSGTAGVPRLAHARRSRGTAQRSLQGRLRSNLRWNRWPSPLSGGQAGLATSRESTKDGLEHIVLVRGRVNSKCLHRHAYHRAQDLTAQRNGLRGSVSVTIASTSTMIPRLVIDDPESAQDSTTKPISRVQDKEAPCRTRVSRPPDWTR
jgi:hypothetical protein